MHSCQCWVVVAVAMRDPPRRQVSISTYPLPVTPAQVRHHNAYALCGPDLVTSRASSVLGHEKAVGRRGRRATLQELCGGARARVRRHDPLRRRLTARAALQWARRLHHRLEEVWLGRCERERHSVLQLRRRLRWRDVRLARRAYVRGHRRRVPACASGAAHDRIAPRARARARPVRSGRADARASQAAARVQVVSAGSKRLPYGLRL